jgi:hypothetical protein
MSFTFYIDCAIYVEIVSPGHRISVSSIQSHVCTAYVLKHTVHENFEGLSKKEISFYRLVVQDLMKSFLVKEQLFM